jgi:hypothetical protein
MNALVNTRQGRRAAHAALNLCRSLEQHRDLEEARRIAANIAKVP